MIQNEYKTELKLTKYGKEDHENTGYLYYSSAPNMSQSKKPNIFTAGSL